MGVFSRHRHLYWEIQISKFKLKEVKEEADQQLKMSSAITISVPQLSDEDRSDDTKRGVASKHWQREVVRA